MFLGVKTHVSINNSIKIIKERGAVINVLFSPSELKKLKKCINKQKYSSSDEEKIRNLNGLHTTISNIERKNRINH